MAHLIEMDHIFKILCMCERKEVKKCVTMSSKCP